MIIHFIGYLLSVQSMRSLTSHFIFIIQHSILNHCCLHSECPRPPRSRLPPPLPLPPLPPFPRPTSPLTPLLFLLLHLFLLLFLLLLVLHLLLSASLPLPNRNLPSIN